ncbi:activating transcription factor 3 isoform X2 [Hyalella azteca]|uniref:Activating transcription factor 3 isoform X2 n=1 Tax=Hyalella azteca TaxID=294128 RepID=A0A979FWN4_HYAAZ|nr:activating transcription factor 3 isoform X2 [Hyalella azteca]
MFLNVGLSAGASDATTPRTPEILNSIISITSPRLPHPYPHYPSGTAELLSPDCSTPGDDIGGLGGWGAADEGGHLLGSGGGESLGYTSLRNASAPFSSQFPASSSLLTPTSDGCSPPLQQGGAIIPQPGGNITQLGDLPSPVSTVEATRSALIKEGLKLQITSKLHQTGTCPESLLKPDPAVVKTELTQEDEERRRRRRERNKLAATKCRNKKKEMTEILMTESESVMDLNARLKGEVERLKVEKERLEKCLTDSRHRQNCKHHRQYDPSQIPSLVLGLPPMPHSSRASPTYPAPSSITSPSYASPSSSSCCSTSSPNSFSSLLSPSTDKIPAYGATSQQPCSGIAEMIEAAEYIDDPSCLGHCYDRHFFDFLTMIKLND